mmetsp:Transcript_13070/g.26209  ORF Transcript_13070/g.26209 Transcript_13070/m.26209 type:complete len:221 (+) Transcript_13070:328-990(+)
METSWCTTCTLPSRRWSRLQLIPEMQLPWIGIPDGHLLWLRVGPEIVLSRYGTWSPHWTQLLTVEATTTTTTAKRVYLGKKFNSTNKKTRILTVAASQMYHLVALAIHCLLPLAYLVFRHTVLHEVRRLYGPRVPPVGEVISLLHLVFRNTFSRYLPRLLKCVGGHRPMTFFLRRTAILPTEQTTRREMIQTSKKRWLIDTIPCWRWQLLDLLVREVRVH